MVLLVLVKNATIHGIHIIFIVPYLHYINLIEISHYFKIKSPVVISCACSSAAFLFFLTDQLIGTTLNDFD